MTKEKQNKSKAENQSNNESVDSKSTNSDKVKKKQSMKQELAVDM